MATVDWSDNDDLNFFNGDSDEENDFDGFNPVD